MAASNVRYRCFVCRLSRRIDGHSLHEAFKRFGEIVESKIITNQSGRPRCYGFITFALEKSMWDAIEGMNGQNLDGMNIIVEKAHSRGSSGGGFRGNVVAGRLVEQSLEPKPARTRRPDAPPAAGTVKGASSSCPPSPSPPAYRPGRPPQAYSNIQYIAPPTVSIPPRPFP